MVSPDSKEKCPTLPLEKNLAASASYTLQFLGENYNVNIQLQKNNVFGFYAHFKVCNGQSKTMVQN
jgi:hypothetical protein